MKPIYKPQQYNPRTLQKPVFPSCCPLSSEQSKLTIVPCFKKNKKFITLTKNIPQKERKVNRVQPMQVQKMVEAPVPHFQVEFQEDKVSFLQQIRKYNPNPEVDKEGEAEQQTGIFDTSKDMNSSGKSNDINLSSFLDSLNNQIFSDMFVSSSVKDKIVLSGSLGSIAEVKSDLEISEMGSLPNTERQR